MEYQTLISLVSMLGAGFASYVGVRVALAEVKRDIAAIEKAAEERKLTMAETIMELKSRVTRLETSYFQERHGGK